jgi:hypothetical protein
MVKLESFSGLSKPQDDLFKKAFCYSNHFGVHYKDTGDAGLTYRVSAKQVQEEGASSLKTGFWTQLNFGKGFTFREDFDATKTFKAALDYVPPEEPNLKLHGEFTAKVADDPQVKPTVSAEYAFPNAKVKLAVSNDPVFKLTSVAGLENLGFGVDLAYDWNKSKLTTYNAALYLTEPSHRLVLKHITNPKAAELELGSVALSGFVKASSDLSVGAEVVYNCSTEKPEAQFAVQKVFDEFHTAKLRFKDSGEVASSVTHKLNSRVAVTTSSCFGLKSLSAWPTFQLGFKLRITS